MTGPAPAMPRAEAAALLGVREDAAPTDVQHAFLRAARRVHPDALPAADDDARRAAGGAFAELLRAREAMLAPRTGRTAPPPMPGDGSRFRRVEGRGLGGSLVILALLAFLLVALVTVEQALRGDPFVGLPGPAASDVR